MAHVCHRICHFHFRVVKKFKGIKKEDRISVDLYLNFTQIINPRHVRIQKRIGVFLQSVSIVVAFLY